jgi:hypothetical protein
MKNIKILALFLLISTSLFSQTKAQPISKFILKNFRVPDSLRKDCNWNYLAVELSINKNNELVYKIKNYTNNQFLKSLDFLKNYKVSEIDKKSLPALIFITVKNQTGDCGDQTYYNPFPADITEIITGLISEELKIFPNIRIEAITSIVYPPRH